MYSNIALITEQNLVVFINSAIQASLTNTGILCILDNFNKYMKFTSIDTYILATSSEKSFCEAERAAGVFLVIPSVAIASLIIFLRPRFFLTGTSFAVAFTMNSSDSVMFKITKVLLRH